MKNTPVLDPRDDKAILEEIRRRARSYTPQWRFDPDDMDAGGALATLFSRMFAQTVDRYNRVLYKDYIEFLNLLAVRQKPVTPAQGYVAVEVAPGTDRPVEIAKDTLFTHDGPDGERVNYLSDEAIFATPARIRSMITVDPARDAVAVREAEEESFDLFHVPDEKNLQRHRFTLRHDEVLRLSRPGCIRVQVLGDAQYLAQQTAERLCRGDFARWEYYSGESWRPFDRVEAEADFVVLTKDSDAPLEPCSPEEDEEGEGGGHCLRCTMARTDDDTALEVRGLQVDSSYREGESLGCDAAYANDVSVDVANGGYCFDENALLYDAFYVACDEVFCKHGAQVTMELDMHTLVRKSDQEQARYEFKDRLVIEKDETPPEPAKRFVSRVVWEYWNGVGWTHLEASGDINPFGEEAEGTKRLSFTIPEDLQPCFVSSVEHHWVRARVTFVENAFDLYATRLLPFVQGLRLRFRYAKTRPVQRLVTENNLQRTTLHPLEGPAAATLYRPLPDARPALYLCFDDAPAGNPVTLFLELQGRSRARRRLQAEAFQGRGFEAVKMTDGLEECAHSGVLKFYLPPLLKQTSVFGQEGWFLRLVDVTGRAAQEDWPRLCRAVLNCLPVTQREQAPDALFSTEIHEAGKRVRLDETPVLEAEVWVDESASLSEQAIRALLEDANQEAGKRGVEAEVTPDGRLSRLLVRWNRTQELALCGPQDRVYELDAEEGRIRFGDGVHGAIPPAGQDNILVRYSFGGGSRGNIGPEGITGVTTTAAGLTRAYNFLPICGGNDMQSVELVERLGPQRLRHRGRAVTPADFEALVLEEFSQARAVRCFPNTDENGQSSPGKVTVVVLCGEMDSPLHATALCERIEKYLSARCDSALARGGLRVVPAQILTVNVTATLEVDAPDNAAAAEREAGRCLDELLDPLRAREGNPIGALPSPTDLYAALRRVPHVLAVRDVLMEGVYDEYNLRRVVALDVGSRYPFAVPRSGRHAICI